MQLYIFVLDISVSSHLLTTTCPSRNFPDELVFFYLVCLMEDILSFNNVKVKEQLVSFVIHM